VKFYSHSPVPKFKLPFSFEFAAQSGIKIVSFVWKKKLYFLGKMIAEKPSWVRHEGMQIFSIDVQPGGLRFATGGGDHKVRNFTFFGAQLWKILNFGCSVV